MPMHGCEGTVEKYQMQAGATLVLLGLHQGCINDSPPSSLPQCPNPCCSYSESVQELPSCLPSLPSEGSLEKTFIFTTWIWLCHSPRGGRGLVTLFPIGDGSALSPLTSECLSTSSPSPTPASTCCCLNYS